MHRALLKIFGLLFMVFGLSLLPPAALAWYYSEPHFATYLEMSALVLAVGAIATFLGPAPDRVLRTRDGFLVVTLAWLSMSLLGAVPFLLIGKLDWADSAAIEVVAIIFMMLGALNFAVHFQSWRSMTLEPYFGNAEARAFVVIVIALCAFVGLVLWLDGDTQPVLALRLAAFQVVSLITSTGFVTDDFSLWPALLPVLLVFTYFIGGCAGSTVLVLFVPGYWRA